MMISVIPVRKVRRVASAVLQMPCANLVACLVLVSSLAANADPAVAHSEAAPRLQHIAPAEPQLSIAPSRGHGYLDRPDNYTPVQSVPFNYGADIFPSWRQILPKF